MGSRLRPRGQKRPPKQQRCGAAAARGGEQLTANTSRSSLKAFKKEQLAGILRSMQLSDTGLKPELVERLHMALQCTDSTGSGSTSGNKAKDIVKGQQFEAGAANGITPGVQTPVEHAPAAAVAQTEISTTVEPQLPAADTTSAPASDSSSAATSSAAAAKSAASSASVQQPAGRRVRVAPDDIRHSAGSPSAAASVSPPPAAAPECDLPTGLAVQWLGTSSGSPTQHRNVSSILFMQRHRVRIALGSISAAS